MSEGNGPDDGQTPENNVADGESDNSDENKDDFARLMQLAGWATGRFEARRNYEWKIMLGLWTGIFVLLYQDWNLPGELFVYPNASWPDVWKLICGILWLCAIAGFGGTWVLGIWRSNTNDKRRVEHYLAKAEKLAGISRNASYPYAITASNPQGEMPRNNKPEYICILDWNVRFQLFATGSLLALVFIKLYLVIAAANLSK